MDYKVFFACVACLLLKSVYGGGYIDVLFISYANDDGQGDNDNDCDGIAFFSRSDCDPYFILCLDWTEHGTTPITDCHVGTTTTGRVHNQNSFVFTSDIGGTANPVTYYYDSFESSTGVTVKVDVWDNDDSTDPDHIELFADKLVSITPAVSAAAAMTQEVVLSGRTTLTLNIKAYCEPDYYGPHCDVQCVVRGDSAHYTCGSDGRKHCLPGWEGNNCDVFSDDCADTPCLNGGECLDGDRSYTCTCTSEYTGANCEQMKEEKDSGNAKPGSDPVPENGAKGFTANSVLFFSVVSVLIALMC